MPFIAIVTGAMLILPIVIGAPAAAFEAAQQVCEYKKKAQEVREQTQDYIVKSKKAFESYAVFNEDLNRQILDVKASVSDNLNASLDLKKNHAIALAKLQIFAGCVIIIVFMLLLGKKLNIY